MDEDVNIAVIHYSATGNVHRLAEALAEGAVKAGAHVDETHDMVPETRLDDLAWADAFAFGTPTRNGMVSAQLKQFLDQTGGVWLNGVLTDKPATAFTSSRSSTRPAATRTACRGRPASHPNCRTARPCGPPSTGDNGSPTSRGG